MLAAAANYDGIGRCHLGSFPINYNPINLTKKHQIRLHTALY